MSHVRVQEIDSKGEALVWEGDLLNIAEELFTEFGLPTQTLRKLELMIHTYHRVGIMSCLLWFVAQMNSLENGYEYKGQVNL